MQARDFIKWHLRGERAKECEWKEDPLLFFRGLQECVPRFGE
jgi:hypothetical protein